MQERLFDALHYISCHENNFGTYSIRLSSLLLEAGSFFDSLCQSFIRWRNEVGQPFPATPQVRDISDKLSAEKNFNVADYRRVFEPEFQLSARKLNLNAYNDHFFAHNSPIVGANPKYEISPLAQWAEDRSPPWWNAFTELKHDRTKHIEQANLKNVLFAFGSAFLVLVFYHVSFARGNADPIVFRLFTPLFFKAGSSQTVMRRFYGISPVQD